MKPIGRINAAKQVVVESIEIMLFIAESQEIREVGVPAIGTGLLGDYRMDTLLKYLTTDCQFENSVPPNWIS